MTCISGVECNFNWRHTRDIRLPSLCPMVLLLGNALPCPFQGALKLECANMCLFSLGAIHLGTHTASSHHLLFRLTLFQAYSIYQRFYLLKYLPPSPLFSWGHDVINNTESPRKPTHCRTLHFRDQVTSTRTVFIRCL